MFNKNVINQKESLIRKYTSLVKQYNDGISLAIGEPAIDVDVNIINSAIDSLNNFECKYTNARGDVNLLKEIALKEQVSENEILVTCGSSEGIFISLLSILNYSDEVIVITPCYPQYEPVISFCGGKTVYVDTSKTNFVPTYDSIISKINSKTKAIIINSPANPTGRMFNNEILKMLDDISIKHNIFLLIDDVYEKIVFKKYNPYKYKTNYKIILKSFSKTYGMTGFRLGYILASNNIINELLKVHSYLFICVPPFVQSAGVSALKITDKKYEEIEENLLIITSYLEDKKIKYVEVDGGIFIFIKVSDFYDNDILFCDNLLSEYHVACVPGSCFNMSGFIRVNFAVKKECLVEGIRRIDMFLNEKNKANK